jgi:hypothetical protein
MSEHHITEAVERRWLEWAGTFPDPLVRADTRRAIEDHSAELAVDPRSAPSGWG